MSKTYDDVMNNFKRVKKEFNSQEDYENWVKDNHLEISVFDADINDPDTDIILDVYIGGICPWDQHVICDTDPDLW